MLDRVISGGQSGADQAGLRAARSAEIPTGGTAPKGWLAEVRMPDDGGPTLWVMKSCPWLADFGLVECETEGFPARTAANVRDSDGTIWFGDWMSSGGRSTLDACRSMRRPFLIVYQGATKPSEVREWIAAKGIRCLNVAGNRESTQIGIGERVEAFLRRVIGVA
jgi:hypothetical protein